MDKQRSNAAWKLRQRFLQIIIDDEETRADVIIGALTQALAGVMAQMPKPLMKDLLLELPARVSNYEVQAREQMEQQPQITVRGSSGHG